MRNFGVLVFVVFLDLSYSFSIKNPICHGTINGWYVDDSCQLWYCNGGKPTTRMPPCSDQMVYSKEYKLCVRRNSVYDDCSGGLLFAKFEDPCINNPCVNGKCLGSGNGENYICSCYPGYIGVHCENDIDECLGNPCKNGGICIDEVNGYTCQCPTMPGDTTFTGTNCETAVEEIGADNDKCSSNPCENDGICSNEVNGYKCKCPNLSGGTTFTGINCETAVEGIEANPLQTGCGSSPCTNGGLCISLGGEGYLCSCQTGYTGIICETEIQVIDVCDSQPCKNGGHCNSSGELTYTCSCTSGYSGNNCEMDLDPCRNSPCLNGGKCSHSDGKYSCDCSVWFTGKNCQTDLNVMAVSECNKGETTFAHPDYCQLYFNCSQTSSPLQKSKSPYLNECIYPQLFNNETKKCDAAFAVIDCGNRKELKSGCDYMRNQYLSAHGRPCNLVYPSCESKPDGIQVNEMKLYGPNLSPYYVMCFKERLIGSGMCGKDGLNERMMFYKHSNPSSGECTSLYKIPKQYGGEKPVCNGANFEIGVVNPAICDKYYVCFSGSTEVMKCPYGTVFQNVSTDTITPCVLKSKACPPCGFKSEGC